MRIGSDGNSLTLELQSLEGGWSACRVEAVVTTSRCRFAAVHDRLMLDSSPAVLQSILDFEELRRGFVEIALTESGWIQLNREERGGVLVSYSLRSHRPIVTMEGTIPVEGEFRGELCRNLRALLEKHNLP